MDNDGRLLGTLFENLAEPDWATDFLRGVCVATRSHAAAVLHVDIASRRHTLPAYFGQGHAVAQAFEQTHAAGNPWRPADEREGHPEGSVVVPDDVLPLRDLRRTAFWVDFLRPMDVDHGCGVIGMRTSEQAVSLTLLRSASAGVYGTSERAWLGSLAGHWVNACRLRQRLITPEPRLWDAAKALDLLPTAAFFLDGAGQCRHWNAAGEELLRDGSLIRLRGGRLVAACPGSGPAALSMSGPAALRHRNGRVAAHAMPHALPGHGPFGAARAVVFVELVRPGELEALRRNLMAVYRLTPREAELVGLLADGHTLPEAAEVMGIDGAAARNRLKVVFQKMGVRHQGGLVVVTSGFKRLPIFWELSKNLV